MAPLPITMDTDAYDYVLDKGTLVSATVNQHGFDGMCALRAFRLRKGFSVPANLPGHYFVNSSDINVADPASVADLPAIVHFKDSATAPALALYWKHGENGKLYLFTIPTAVKVSTNSETGQDKWVQEKDGTVVKLEMVERLDAVENRDGQAIGKAVDEWLKSHSSTFRTLGINSLIDCRTWCQRMMEVDHHVHLVGLAAQRALRQTIADSVGVTSGEGDEDQPAKKARTSSAAEATLTEAQEAAYKQRLPALKSAFRQLEMHVFYLKVPPSFRMIELDDLAVGKESYTDTEIIEMVKGATSAQHEEKLIQVLKSTDKLRLLSELEGKVDFTMSPFKAPAPGTGEPSGSNDEIRPEFDGGGGDDGSKRQRKQVTRLDPSEQPATGKAPKAAEKATGTQAKDRKERGKYNMTGLNSQFPEVRAAARLRMGLSPDSGVTLARGGTPPTETPAGGGRGVVRTARGSILAGRASRFKLCLNLNSRLACDLCPVALRR